MIMHKAWSLNIHADSHEKCSSVQIFLLIKEMQLYILYISCYLYSTRNPQNTILHAHIWWKHSSQHVFHSDSILPGRSSCPFFMAGHTVSPSNLFKSSSEKFISDMSVISGLSAATYHQRICSDGYKRDIHPPHNRRQIVQQTHIFYNKIIIIIHFN